MIPGLMAEVRQGWRRAGEHSVFVMAMFGECRRSPFLRKGGMSVDMRLGFVGIVIEDRRQAEEVNRVLSQFGDIIRGRIGVPDQETGRAVIGVIVEGTNDQVGAMTGRLGNLSGVTVKSALTARKARNGES